MIELKLVSVSARSSVFSTGADSAASVNTKASMVAIFGAIMPDPLAMPASETFTPSISQIAPAPLANVSVVMIAAAACGHCTAVSSIFASAVSMLAASSTTPMTPVEAASISRPPPSADLGRGRLQRAFAGGLAPERR